MKNIKLAAALAITSTLVFSSCDSSTPLATDTSVPAGSNPSSQLSTNTVTYGQFVFDLGTGGGPNGENIGIALDARARSLNYMLGGDTLDHLTIAGFGIAPFEDLDLTPGETTFNEGSSITSVENEAVYSYIKTGDHTFILTADLPDTAKNETEQAIAGLFGEPSSIAVAFRQLLFDPGAATPSFTRVQLQEMVDAIGVRWLIVDPDEDQIIILDDSKIFIEYTSRSSNRDILELAEMTGDFIADLYGVKQVLRFRRPTVVEINTFNTGIRALTPEHWLPVIESMPSKDFIDVQAGDFTIKLINTPAGIIR